MHDSSLFKIAGSRHNYLLPASIICVTQRKDWLISYERSIHQNTFHGNRPVHFMLLLI